MKILFSNLPWWHYDQKEIDRDGQTTLRIGVRAGSRWPFTRASIHKPDEFRFGGYLPVPFFMCSAAAYAKRAFPEATVEIRDSIARGESYESFLNHLKWEQPDWLIVESATPCWEHDVGVIGVIKALLPKIKVIITGTVVSGCDFKQPDNVFACIKGEYEKNVVKAIGWGTSTDIVRVEGAMEFDLLTLEEMNALPFPMFDEACATRYADCCPHGQQFPQLQVWTSRGCPFRCVWCAWPATMTGADPDGTGKRKVRGHSPQWVEAMLRDRLTKAEAAGTPYKCIYLDDDTFNLTEAHTLAMCGAMQRIGLPWSAMCRADTISDAAWQAMKDAGCFGVKLGFESGSQRVIDQIINKRLDIHKAAATARRIRAMGMTVHGTFTIGMPGETAEEQQQTKDFIQDLYATRAIDSHQLSGTAVIEGTPMANLIASGQDLPKYPGAHADPSFRAMGDGQLKVEQMTRALR